MVIRGSDAWKKGGLTSGQASGKAHEKIALLAPFLWSWTLGSPEGSCVLSHGDSASCEWLLGGQCLWRLDWHCVTERRNLGHDSSCPLGWQGRQGALNCSCWEGDTQGIFREHDSGRETSGQMELVTNPISTGPFMARPCGSGEGKPSGSPGPALAEWMLPTLGGHHRGQALLRPFPQDSAR